MKNFYSQAAYKFTEMQSKTHHETFPVIVYNTLIDMDHLMHSHDFIEIVFVKSGSGTHILQDIRHPLIAGDVFVIPREVKHGYCDVKDLNLLNFMFQMSSVDQRFPELKRMPGFFSFFVADSASKKMKYNIGRLLNLTQEELAVVKDLYEEILREEDEMKSGAASASLIHLLRLLIYLSRLLEEKENSPFKITEYNNLPKVYDFINNNLNKKISIDELARIACMSKRNFQRIFMQVNNLNTSQYIMKVRLEKARDLLINTSMSISIIAFKTGFQGGAYFAKQFKKYFSVTPFRYRNIVKNRSL